MRRKDREINDISEIEEIIKKCRTCHLAMAEEGIPYVVPLSFGYERNNDEFTFYFHSTKSEEGKKFSLLRKNNKVSFDMVSRGEAIQSENPCNFGYYFSSIIGYGEVEFVEDSKEKCRALSLLMRQQADQEIVFHETQAENVRIYKIRAVQLCGKKR